MRLNGFRSCTWLLCAALLAGTTAPAHATGGGAAAYQQLLVGARALGMGGAFTGLADDATAVFYNPAGISAFEDNQIHASHASLSFDRNFNYVAMAFPVKKGETAWGLSYTRFSVDGIPETRVVNGTNTPITDAAGNVQIFSLFDDIEDNFVVSYAWKATEKMRVGANARLLHAELFRQEANGQGLDLSMLYQVNKDLRLGVSARDLVSGIRWNFSQHRDKVPFTLTAGASLRGWKDAIYLLDVFMRESDNAGYRVGVEKWWAGHYALRAGVNDGDIAVGASAKYRQFQFDYAFQEQDLGDINRISMNYKF